MPTVEANGQRLYYEEQGDGEPLLCVMGLAADVLAWTLQLPAFSAHHRTVVFDNRDVGRSSRAEGSYEISDMAQDALALADALGLERFHVLGVSMGGAIAQEMALAAPERLATLTLAVTYGGSGRAGRVLAASWSAEALRATREEQVDKLLYLTLSERMFEDEQMVEYMRTLSLQNPHPQEPEAFIRQLDASSRHETRDRLPGIDLPVHVIGAEHDILVPVWKSREVAELIPGSRLSVMAAAPHGVNVEGAQEFNALVLDFIAEHSGVAA
jgi:pimeloyl-ACP methyl ester carboxylesterase